MPSAVKASTSLISFFICMKLNGYEKVFPEAHFRTKAPDGYWGFFYCAWVCVPV